MHPLELNPNIFTKEWYCRLPSHLTLPIIYISNTVSCFPWIFFHFYVKLPALDAGLVDELYLSESHPYHAVPCPWFMPSYASKYSAGLGGSRKPIQKASVSCPAWLQLGSTLNFSLLLLPPFSFERVFLKLLQALQATMGRWQQFSYQSAMVSSQMNWYWMPRWAFSVEFHDISPCHIWCLVISKSKGSAMGKGGSWEAQHGTSQLWSPPFLPAESDSFLLAPFGAGFTVYENYFLCYYYGLLTFAVAWMADNDSHSFLLVS